MARSARRLRALALAGKGSVAAALRHGRLAPLLFFTDPLRTPDPRAAVARLPRRSAVVFRAFGRADIEARGAGLAQVARRAGVRLFVGADARLAVRLSADGVHLPQRAAGHRGRIFRLKQRFVVTAAAHNLPAVLRAVRSGVDAVVISPVFASASPSAGTPLGVRRLTGLVRAAGVPVYALGGIDAVSARRLARSGVAGLAAVEGLLGGEGRGGASSETRRSELEGGLQPHTRRRRLRVHEW